MISLELQKTVSYDELMSLGSDARVEVFNGEIREMLPVGGTHAYGSASFVENVAPFVRSQRLGLVYGDGLTFLMLKPGETPHGLRDSYVPDAAFICASSIPRDWDRAKPFPYSPTLAVEIMSPDDKGEDIDLKVQRYLELVPSQYSFDGYNLYNSRLKREFVSIISTLTGY